MQTVFGKTAGGIAYFSGYLPVTSLGGHFLSQNLLLVFAHANGFCKEVWHPLIEEMGLLLQSTTEERAGSKDARTNILDLIPTENFRNQVRFVAFDFWGHGESEKLCPSQSGKLPEWRECLVPAVREVLQQFGSEDERNFPGTKRDIIAVGHSLGGTACMMYELSYPNTFKTMVLFEPVILPPADNVIAELFAQNQLEDFQSSTITSFLESHPNPLTKRALKRQKFWNSRSEAFHYFRDRFTTFDDRCLQEYCKGGLQEKNENDSHGKAGCVLQCEPLTEAIYYAGVGQSLFPDLIKFKCPITFGVGSESAHFSVEHFRNIAAHIRSKTSVSIINGATHFCPLELPSLCANIVLQNMLKNVVSRL